MPYSTHGKLATTASKRSVSKERSLGRAESHVLEFGARGSD
jgi:hypothetical protein